MQHFSLKLAKILLLFQNFAIFSHLVVQHELVAERKECGERNADIKKLLAEKRESSGRSIDTDYSATLEECAEQCKNVASMFIYGREGTNKCKPLIGCRCFCERIAASSNGKCKRYQQDNANFNLYRFVLKGMMSFV